MYVTKPMPSGGSAHGYVILLIEFTKYRQFLSYRRVQFLKF
jgi:hypothetical protein